ncbi:MAG: type I methionyl aminopeptidase [Minisyncoccia bacterium]
MIIRSEKERAGVIESGRRLGVVLEEVAKAVRPGVSTAELDALAERLIREGGDTPAFLDYKPERSGRAYPATLCVSVNDEVVHGLPNESPRTLQEGDIVALDLGLSHQNFISDSAITVPVGRIDEESQRLMEVTRAALEAAILVALPGARVGDISHAIESSYQGTGFSVVQELGGHGVGGAVHEEPWIANAGHPGTGPELVAGMVLAIEPIGNAGKAAVMLAKDQWTYKTRDGSRSAHFEHTIIIEEGGALVTTRRPSEKA